MSDPFNSLISTGAAPVLFAASNMFGQQRARNDVLQDRAAAREQNMLQFILASGAQERQSMREQRQFELQSQAGDRSFALQREESAFARLNSVLDRQLKMAELESKDRQLAFENSLKAMSVAIDAKSKGMQLKQFERSMQVDDAIGEVRQLATMMSTGTIDPGVARDKLAKITGSGALGWMNEQQYAAAMPVIQASGQMLAEYDLGDEALPGAKLSYAELEERSKGLRLAAGSYEPGQIEVLNNLFVRSGAAQVSGGRERLGKILNYLEDNKGVAHLDSIREQLNDPAAVIALKSQMDVGLVRPSLDRDTYAKVYQFKQRLQEVEARYDRDYGPAWRVLEDDPDMVDLREGLERAKQDGVAKIISGGNPMAKYVADGMAADFEGEVNPLIREYVDFARRTAFDPTVGFGVARNPEGSGVPARNFFGAARNLLGNVVTVGGESVKYATIDMPSFDAAAARVASAAQAMVMADSTGRIDPIIFEEARAALDDYKRLVRAAYRTAGLPDIPLPVQQLLKFDRVYPRRYAQKLDLRARHQLREQGVDLGGSFHTQSLRRMAPALQGGPTATTGTATPGGALFAGGGFEPE